MESERYKIKVIGHTKKDGHMHYIINVENNGQNFSFLERYSGLRYLNDAMRKCINKPTFPKFPPKKFFGSEDEKFIIKRQQEINIYFELICKDSDLVNLPPLKKFIEEKRKQNENEKTPQIKKDSIKMEEKELKKSIKNMNDKEYCDKILKEYNNKFYHIKDVYIRDNMSENDDSRYTKFFENNKINKDNNDVKLDKGDDNNFSIINCDDNIIKIYENNIKNKINKIDELYQSLDKTYNTDGIVVPI
jgi:uncharacterized protein (UPF0332 family)